MTEEHAIQAISVNLLRLSLWYYKDPEANRQLCQRYLQQSKQLGENISSPQVRPYIAKLQSLHLSGSESPARTAERFLTLGVLMQHPQKWMKK